MRRGSFGRTVVALVLLPLGNALADSPDKPAANRDELSPWALGVGLGLVRSSDQGDLYFAASLRRRIHFRMPAADPSADAPGPAGGADTEQGRPGRVYVEPEVGYWKRSENGLDEKDLLVGVNLVGVVPTRAFDLFLGAGFGTHFHEQDVPESGVVSTVKEKRFGANVQFGVEADLSRSVGIFGVGRVDIVQDKPSQQSKVWGGLRFRF